MTTPRNVREFEILAWLKERGMNVTATVGDLATHFHSNPEVMKDHVERLQRMECLKRAGIGHAAWLITEAGLCRLGLGQDALEWEESIFSRGPPQPRGTHATMKRLKRRPFPEAG